MQDVAATIGVFTLIKREVLIFLMVGVLTVLIDFGVYSLLFSILLIEMSIAKLLGFLVGTVFAYMANKRWTFRYVESVGNIPRFAVLYASTLVINVGVNAFVVNVVGSSQITFRVAFVLATGCSAALNFLGMKYFVFKSNHPN